jgi:hypothetical protein
MVTFVGDDGQVNTGAAIAGLSKPPAVAVHANVGVSEPAATVAASAIVLLTVVSSGEADSEVMVVQIAVEPLTTTDPAPLPFAVQVSVTDTGLVTPDMTENGAEPAHENAPSAVVAVRAIV